MADGERHLPRGGLAIRADPARQQPRRNVQRLRFDFVDQRLSLAGAAAQHRVDEAGIFRGAAVRLHQPHREIDGGMIGHIHPENLRGADQQRALRARRIGRDAAIEQARQQMTERAEPPQDRRHQPPHQRAVAIGERLQSGMRACAVELVVEGAMLVQHAVENVGRDPPRRETGHFGQVLQILKVAWSGNVSERGGKVLAHAIGMKNSFGMRICQM